jgi:hypothetical protein
VKTKPPATRFQKIAFWSLIGSIAFFVTVFVAVGLASSQDPHNPVVPLVSVAPTPTATKSPTKLATKSPTKSRSTQTVIQGVTPGAFCSEHGAYGRSDAGNLYRCATTSTDDNYRWRRV